MLGLSRKPRKLPLTWTWTDATTADPTVTFRTRSLATFKRRRTLLGFVKYALRYWRSDYREERKETK